MSCCEGLLRLATKLASCLDASVAPLQSWRRSAKGWCWSSARCRTPPSWSERRGLQRLQMPLLRSRHAE